MKMKRTKVERKVQRARTDHDYVRLDEAIATIMDWQEEIVDQLAVHGESRKALAAVQRAMNQVHSPEED